MYRTPILDNNKVAWFQMLNCVSTYAIFYAKGAQFITVERQSKTGSSQSRLYLLLLTRPPPPQKK